MSGYLEVKYPFKSNLGLNPFKSWKRQWCILRPSPTCSGGSLAVYCSEAGTVAGSVELPSGSVVRRTKSRTRPYAFAVFPADDRKPRVLLAAQSLQEAHTWMEKIQSLLNGESQLGTETLLKDSYSVSIVATDLANRCGLAGDGLITVSSNGLTFNRTQKLGTVIEWKHINDVYLSSEDKNRMCIFIVDSEYSGGGELRLCTPLAASLAGAARRRPPRPARPARPLSSSDGDLPPADSDPEVRRSSWYSGPSDMSLDDMDLVMSKESPCTPLGQQPRGVRGARARLHSVPARFDDSLSDRRSLLSIASGIYEEIPDLPETPKSQAEADMYCKMGRGEGAELKTEGAGLKAEGVLKGATLHLEEPTYESVAECVYATMRRPGRRHPPPPLPPRLPTGTMKGSIWSAEAGAGGEEAGGRGVTRHVSLGALPRCGSLQREHCKPRFSVFRKRLKSDSRIATSPKSDIAKENKDVETKKKKFDFTPTRDIFKNFKVSRKMKNLKITPGLGKGETKSCEFLDETEHVTTNRCSKSVECLEDDFLDEVDGDISIDSNDDAVAALALPQEILDLILRGREQLNKIRLKDQQVEGDYMPMSPIVPPAPIEHHYIVMSPKTNIA